MRKKIYVCPKCGRALNFSDNLEYTFQCMDCDEDFYTFEAKEVEQPMVNTTYKLDHHEYINIAKRLADVIKWHESETSNEVLLELLRVRCDEGGYFKVPKHLMQRIAIINMCDMALTQLNDSCGEIDYADLGDHSKEILLSIFKEV